MGGQPEELEILIDTAKQGNSKSRNEIITSMKPLLLYFIKRWRETHYRADVSQDNDDDMTSAMICCDWAIDAFDKNGGSKFSSFLYTQLTLEFSNQMRRDMATKRTVDRSSISLSQEDRDGEELEIDIPYTTDVTGSMIVTQFLNSLETDDRRIVEAALLDDDVEGLIYSNSIRRKFLDFFPDYRKAIYQRVFAQRLQTAFGIYMATRDEYE